MTRESPPALILFASVSCGPIVLADHFPAGEHPSVGFAASAGGEDLTSIAARCLDAAPRFHLLYTHTACRRIYAFLIAEPLLFFAIADESLGSPAVLLFLHRLRDGASFAACRRIDAGGPLPHLCLQDELDPVIRSLALSFSTSSLEEEDRPSPSPPPPSSDSHLLTGEHKRKVKKNQKKNARSEEAGVGCELEITVMDDGGVADRGRKSPQRIWRQQVRMVLVVDLIVCSILFGIWLSVCRGFQCIDS